MSSRSSLRRKVVLPVTLIRHGGQEKQLAHTLDLTQTSARLGGLASLLKPGEVIELQRGAVRAKFQVVWMGDQGGAMTGQAGVRSLEPNKIIWNVELPEDESDCHVAINDLRNTPHVQTQSEFPGEKRWHQRLACAGSVAVKAATCTFPINGEVKDISKGGLYAEVNTPLPVNSKITMKLCIEGICFESAGVVRTSYPLLGMGISFQDLSPQSMQRLNAILEKIQPASTPEEVTPLELAPDSSSLTIRSESQESAAHVLARACRMLTYDFDSWERSQSSADVRELKDAISQLQQKLSLTLHPDFQSFSPTNAAGADQSNPSVSPALWAINSTNNSSKGI